MPPDHHRITILLQIEGSDSFVWPFECCVGFVAFKWCSQDVSTESWVGCVALRGDVWALIRTVWLSGGLYKASGLLCGSQGCCVGSQEGNVALMWALRWSLQSLRSALWLSGVMCGLSGGL